MTHMQTILKALFEDTPLADDCAACQAGLPAYIDAELDGRPAAELFANAAGHLVTCTDCQQEYTALKHLLRLERQGQLEQPPVEGVFDFAYLPAAPTAPAALPWRLDDLGRLVIQFTADLLRSLQGPAWQPAYLKSGRAPALDYRLTGEVADLNVHITAEPAPGDPQQLIVEVGVDIPSRGGWPNLAGNLVTLRRSTGDVIEVQETDAFGKVVFEHVPAAELPYLAVEVAVD